MGMTRTLAVKPCLSAFSREMALPASDLGPVDLRALMLFCLESCFLVSFIGVVSF